ncbi:MAG: DUF4430 domain-containing protein [Patescibacteria group bacterium]
MSKLNIKRVILYFLALALGVGVGFGIKSFTRPATAPIIEEGENQFSLIINFGDNTSSFQNIQFENEETLFSATKRVAEGNGLAFEFEDYGDLGVLVTGVGDKTGGDNAYWQYWVNGEYAQVGASFYKIQSADEIEWRFTDAQQ